MDRTAGDGHRPDGEDRGEGRDRLTKHDHHESAEGAHHGPDQTVRRRARRILGRLRTGIRVSIPNAAAISPPGRAAASPDGDRQVDERRVDAEHARMDSGASASRRSVGHDAAAVHDHHRGKKWAARARSWRTATTVVPSRSLRSTRSSMISTWCRMSR
jgi:hypothetical protein